MTKLKELIHWSCHKWQISALSHHCTSVNIGLYGTCSVYVSWRPWPWPVLFKHVRFRCVVLWWVLDMSEDRLTVTLPCFFMSFVLPRHVPSTSALLSRLTKIRLKKCVVYWPMDGCDSQNSGRALIHISHFHFLGRKINGRSSDEVRQSSVKKVRHVNSSFGLQKFGAVPADWYS